MRRTNILPFFRGAVLAEFKFAFDAGDGNAESHDTGQHGAADPTQQRRHDDPPDAAEPGVPVGEAGAGPVVVGLVAGQL